MNTLVTPLEPATQRQHRWPGGTAVAAVYASSDASTAQPAWRFGELTITGSGAMPPLPGYRRHIALLEGEGLLVMHEGDERTELLEIGESGGMALAGSNEVELVEGTVRLLDLVVDAERYQTEAFVLEAEHNMRAVDAELLILYGLEGERMHCILDEHEFALSAQQWIRVDRPPQSDLQCTDGRVLVLAAKSV